MTRVRRALAVLAAVASVTLLAMWSQVWMAPEALIDLLRLDPSLLFDDAGRDAYWSTFELNAGSPGYGILSTVGVVFWMLGAVAIVAGLRASTRLTRWAVGGLLLLAALLTLTAIAFGELTPMLTAAAVAAFAVITGRLGSPALGHRPARA